MLSPHFNVSKFIMEEWNSFPVTIDYKFNGEEKGHTMEIIKKKSNFPVTQKVTFDNKVGDCSLLVRYADSADILPGLPREIAKYEIKAAKLKHAADRDHKYEFLLMVSNNIHQIPCLENAQIVEDWIEEKKVAKPKPAAAPVEEGKEPKPDEPEEFEIKTQSKSITSTVSWETSSYALTPEQRKVCKDVEEQLLLSDKKYLDWKEARNDLEGYSYKIRNQLSDGCPWVPFIDETLRQPLLDEVNKCVDWLYEDGETAPLLEYHQKLSKFKNLVEPVKERAIFFEMIPEVYKQFDQFKVKILK